MSVIITTVWHRVFIFHFELIKNTVKRACSYHNIIWLVLATMLVKFY